MIILKEFITFEIFVIGECWTSMMTLGQRSTNSRSVFDNGYKVMRPSNSRERGTLHRTSLTSFWTKKS